MSLKKIITKIHYDKTITPPIILRFAEPFYKVASGFRNFLYDKKVLKSEKVNAKVISVGNITTGGVGKTPIVAKLAQTLIDRGEKVAIISRGYGGELNNDTPNVISDGIKVFYDAKMSGDEPFWLVQNVPQAIVITCRNRVDAANFAIAKFAVTTIILDDGFQHRRIYRDLDLLLIDSQKAFGNEHVLPAGPLRETTKSLRRADKILIISKDFDHQHGEKFAKVAKKRIGKPTFLCRVEPDKIYNIKTSEFLKEGARVNAMSAIGQPEQFYNFVKILYDVKATYSFDDHHVYTEKDLEKIHGKIVTTEKDAVKLTKFPRNDIFALSLKTEFDVEAVLND